ncbi:MAG TPA: S1/P1 nuclease [Candidatus Binataceae bacterium]|nr:S1/P1 nuclease [Candidatus Binataceae bacterium]
MALAWGEEGHQIVASIAADRLRAPARAQVARILGLQDQPGAVAAAMARISVWPDTEYRREDPASELWHFIDLCLQDRPSDIAARCPGEACVVDQVNQFAKRLRSQVYDRWGGEGDLAFEIHLVGDLFQPLHAATDHDLGGNCEKVISPVRARNLHNAWDDAVVWQLETQLGANDASQSARRLQALYPPTAEQMHWGPDSAAHIAWHSHELALSAVYQPLAIPLQPCAPLLSCYEVPRRTVVLSQDYLNQSAHLAGAQLAAAGYRLAALLNSIWDANLK